MKHYRHLIWPVVLLSVLLIIFWQWGFSEQLDWTLDAADISVISAETTNGAITLEGSVQDKVIVRAFKRVRAWNRANAEKFAKEVQVHVERRGNEIKIYKNIPNRHGAPASVSPMKFSVRPLLVSIYIQPTARSRSTA